MKATEEHHQRVAKLLFSTVYPLYLQKVERKGRNQTELNQVIEWLTGFRAEQIEQMIRENISFETFFDRASLHPNATLITGVICGYRIEELDNDLTKKVRYLDKLVDELAKGKSMDKIFRKAK